MRLCLVTLLLLIAPASFASTPQPEPAFSLTDAMHDFAKYLEKLRVFSAEKEPTKEENIVIEENLRELNVKIQAMKAENLPPNKPYKISLKALQQHMKETERIYRLGNRQYARWMLNGTTNLCLMCHTQLPEAKKLQSFWTYKPSLKTVQDQFHEAEFLYVTRRFSQAIPIYDQLVEEYPGNKLNTAELDVVLRRKVAYFARVRRDAKAGVANLERDLTNKKVPEAIQRNLTAWIGLFRKWSKEKTDLNIDTAKGSEVIKFVNQQLEKTLWDRMIEANDPRVVTHLRVSGLLYEYLYTHPADAFTPEILLLLGRSETYLNNQFFYSLGDLYYRECIQGFPTSPVAKNCYAELEKNLNEAYTGTTGRSVPPEVEAELSAYRELLGIKKK